MPPSDTEPETPPGQNIAITAESLYLANLLLVPGLGFILLLVLYLRFRRQTTPLNCS